MLPLTVLLHTIAERARLKRKRRDGSGEMVARDMDDDNNDNLTRIAPQELKEWKSAKEEGARVRWTVISARII